MIIAHSHIYFSSGEDYYEVFPVDNVLKPWKLSDYISLGEASDEVFARDVVLEEEFNEKGMKGRVRHKFKNFVGLKQQMYTLSYFVSNSTFPVLTLIIDSLS